MCELCKCVASSPRRIAGADVQQWHLMPLDLLEPLEPLEPGQESGAPIPLLIDEIPGRTRRTGPGLDAGHHILPTRVSGERGGGRNKGYAPRCYVPIFFFGRRFIFRVCIALYSKSNERPGASKGEAATQRALQKRSK